MEYSKYCHYYKKDCSKEFPNRFPPCCVSACVELLKEVSSILESNGIEYFLSCGTLLGKIRHGGIIPWDDDLDLFCWEKDKLFVEYLLKSKLPKRLVQRLIGGTVNDTTPSYDYICIDYSKVNANRLDIGFLQKINEAYYIDSTAQQANECKSPDIFEKYRGWILPTKHIYPLRRTKFYDVDCYIPNESEKLLKYWYGDDVLKIAYIKPKSCSGYIGNLKKTEITNFVPAEILKRKTLNQSGTGNLIYKAHVINISGRIDRLHNAINECDKMNLWANIVPAVEGYKINHEKIFFDFSSTRFMHINEIGCFLSHLKCLELIASDKNDEHLHLVLEDDVCLAENFNYIIQKNIDFIKQNKGIYLLGGVLYDGLQRKKIYGNIYETGLNVGTYSYMMTGSTARKIIELAFPAKHPFDLYVTFFDTGLFDLPKDNEFGYDSRLATVLKNYRVFDDKDENSTNEQFGIAKELSSTIKESTSSTSYHKDDKNQQKSKSSSLDCILEGGNCTLKGGFCRQTLIIFCVLLLIVFLVIFILYHKYFKNIEY